MEEKLKPIFNKRIFWDVDFENVNYDAKANFVIERVFERGDVEDIRNCRRYYVEEKVSEALLNCKVSTRNKNVPGKCCNQQTYDRIQMLQIETVEPHAFSILKQLVEMPELKDFSTIGYLLLSLQYLS